LPKRAAQIMDEDADAIDVSAISVWEVAIKWARRKGLSNDIPMSGRNLLDELNQAMIEPLAIKSVHAAALDDLPMLHGDPFDRLLLATARHEGMTLLTHDVKLADYGDFVLVV
jgi:PIN domain nuclease of toxin-antitoxin system